MTEVFKSRYPGKAPGTQFLENLTPGLIWCNKCRWILAGKEGPYFARVLIIKPRGEAPIIACRKCYILDLDERDCVHATELQLIDSLCVCGKLRSKHIDDVCFVTGSGTFEEASKFLLTDGGAT